MSTKFKVLKPNPLAKITNPGGFPIPNYTYRVRSTCPGNLIAYWPMSEDSGGTAQDESGNGRTGSYNNISLGQAGIGDTRTAPYFTSAINNVYSTSLRNAFSFSEATLSFWIKIPAIVWSDGTPRRMFEFSEGSANSIHFRRGVANSAVNFFYSGNATQLTMTVSGLSSTDWIHCVATISRSASQHRVYTDGIFRTQSTSVVAISGSINDANSCWGQGTSPDGTNRFSGSMCHCAIWDTALSETQVKFLSKS